MSVGGRCKPCSLLLAHGAKPSWCEATPQVMCTLWDLLVWVQFSLGAGRTQDRSRISSRVQLLGWVMGKPTKKDIKLQELPPALPLFLTGERTQSFVPPCAGCWAATNLWRSWSASPPSPPSPWPWRPTTAAGYAGVPFLRWGLGALSHVPWPGGEGWRAWGSSPCSRSEWLPAHHPPPCHCMHQSRAWLYFSFRSLHLFNNYGS